MRLRSVYRRISLTTDEASLTRPNGSLCDYLSDSIDDGQSWVADNDLWLRYVAYDVQQKFKTNKSIRREYANVFSRVRECL
jgi:hypothetical protein